MYLLPVGTTLAGYALGGYRQSKPSDRPFGARLRACSVCVGLWGSVDLLVSGYSLGMKPAYILPQPLWAEDLYLVAIAEDLLLKVVARA